MVETLKVRVGFQHHCRLREIEIEISRLPRHCLMPPAEQKAWHGDSLGEMLVLKPLLELRLAAGSDIIEDRKNSGERFGHQPPLTPCVPVNSE
jgi:hypothetical protein